jgi:hypothetical protein
MKKSKYPANIAFIEEFEIYKETSYLVFCPIRQTKKHLVRQMNVKSTFIYEKN